MKLTFARAAALALAAVAVLASPGAAQGRSAEDTRTIDAYRLTMPVLRKVLPALYAPEGRSCPRENGRDPHSLSIAEMTRSLERCGPVLQSLKRAGSTGPIQTFGSGTARTFVTLNPAGDPTAVGVLLSESVLSSLPETLTEVILPLPDEGADTPFNFVRVTFGPQGHPPPDIYDKPHFDFHFFLITEQEVAAIGPSDPEFQQKGAQTPPPDFTPPDYVPDPMAIPGHGTHWSDPTSPEFQGQPFTATLIYGFYEGRVIHLEPMVTSAFLLTQPDFTAAIKLPASFAEPGLYPTNFKVTFDAPTGEYVISLDDLTSRS
jgi:hypothetical protein